MQVRITQLRGQVKHASAEARADIKKAIGELEKKKDRPEKREDIHSATALLGAGEVENRGCDGRSSRFSHTSPVLSPVT